MNNRNIRPAINNRFWKQTKKLRFRFNVFIKMIRPKNKSLFYSSFTVILMNWPYFSQLQFHKCMHELFRYRYRHHISFSSMCAWIDGPHTIVQKVVNDASERMLLSIRLLLFGPSSDTRTHKIEWKHSSNLNTYINNIVWCNLRKNYICISFPNGENGLCIRLRFTNEWIKSLFSKKGKRKEQPISNIGNKITWKWNTNPTN